MMINAVSKNKTTHFINPNSKRTLCNINVRKGNWTFYSAKVEHPKCECCQKRAERFYYWMQHKNPNVSYST